jgi:hypothetical protein
VAAISSLIQPSSCLPSALYLLKKWHLSSAAPHLKTKNIKKWHIKQYLFILDKKMAQSVLSLTPSALITYLSPQIVWWSGKPER